MKTTTSICNPDLHEQITVAINLRKSKSKSKPIKRDKKEEARILNNLAIFMLNAICIFGEVLGYLAILLFLERLELCTPIFYICSAIIGFAEIIIFGLAVEFIECRIVKNKMDV